MLIFFDQMSSFDFSNQKTKSVRESKPQKLHTVDKRRSLPSHFVHNSNVSKPAQNTSNTSARSAAKSPRTLSVLPRSSPKTFYKIITYRSSVNGDGERTDSHSSPKPRSKSLKDLPSNKLYESDINTRYSLVKSPKQSPKSQRVPFQLSKDDLLSGSRDESEEGKRLENRGPRRAASALPKLEKLRGTLITLRFGSYPRNSDLLLNWVILKHCDQNLCN